MKKIARSATGTCKIKNAKYILMFEMDYKDSIKGQVDQKGLGRVDHYDIACRMIMKGWRKYELNK